MFCSGCGETLEAGQQACPKCNRPVAPAVPVPPPVPNLEFEVAQYAGKIRVLGILWLVYAGLSLIAGIAAMTFLRAMFSGGFGPWPHGSGPQLWFLPALIHFAWVFMVGRSILAVAAGWGLLERAQWGRIVAIVAAVLNLFHFFPFGLAMGIATLVLIIGSRNWFLYENL
ncbi:MAG: hypothetical protein ACLQG3_11290 [Terracidiphilus sp.]